MVGECIPGKIFGIIKGSTYVYNMSFEKVRHSAQKFEVKF